MAIHSPQEQDAPSNLTAQIQAWSFATIESTVDLSTQATNTLNIPLDTPITDANTGGNASAALNGSGRLKIAKASRKDVSEGTAEPAGRESQKTRIKLIKGKEGSRRRQRWENDNLLHIPNVQPPLPTDWEPHPTHPTFNVPYYLAPLWESTLQHRANTSIATRDARAAASGQKGRVPAELKMKLKKAKGAKTLLQELEEEVRKFVAEWEKKERGEEVEMDSEDEEIVFVGRDGSMSDAQRKVVEAELEREKLVFDSLADEQSGSFGRWLVHSLALYYGLSSRSVTVGDRREAYVGIKSLKTGRAEVGSGVGGELPRPLWGMI